MTTPTRIAFSGVAGSGKDTASIPFMHRDYAPVKFAAPFKNMMRHLLTYQGVKEREISRMLAGDLKNIPHAALGGKTPRYAMQMIGTEWGREKLHDDFWLNALDAHMKMIGEESNFVLTDCRFPNEVKWLRDNGWHVVRINRPGVSNKPGTHASEAQIATLDVNEELTNNYNTPGEFITAVSLHYFGAKDTAPYICRSPQTLELV